MIIMILTNFIIPIIPIILILILTIFIIIIIILILILTNCKSSSSTRSFPSPGIEAASSLREPPGLNTLSMMMMINDHADNDDHRCHCHLQEVD